MGGEDRKGQGLYVGRKEKDGKGKGNDTTSRATSHSVRCLTDSNQQ